MKRSFNFLLVMLLVLVTIVIPHTTSMVSDNVTLYVDDDNTVGPWDGTQEYPFQFIQDAIDAAADGDTVFVYNGTYFENVEVDKSVNLIGENCSKTIIDGNKIGAAVAIFCDSVSLSGFTLKRGSMDGFHTAGVVLHANFSTISRNLITNNEYGIWSFKLSCNNSIEDNSIIDNSRFGILLEGSSNDNRIVGNTILNSSGCHGIFLTGSRNHVSANYLMNQHTGMSVYGSHNCISDNIIVGNSGNGIMVGFSDSIVQNNTVKDHTTFGILVYGSSSNISIINNILEDNGENIYLLDYCSGCSICDNILNNSKYNGIFLSLCSSILIEGNVLSDDKEQGIHLFMSSDTFVVNNSVSGSGTFGILLSLFSDNNIVWGNTVFNTSWVGMILHYASDNLICENDVSYNAEYGIVLEQHSVNNTIRENAIVSHDINGMYLDNSSGNTVVGNTFKRNTKHAFFRNCEDTCWKSNYWGRPRLLPYLIFGRSGSRLAITVDWHPRFFQNT